MAPLSSLRSVHGRLLLATLLLTSAVATAGCATTSDYTTTIGEPTTGAVIVDLSVYDINERDGVRYELQYRRNASDDTVYTVEVYERTSDASELVSVSKLDFNELVHRDDVPPPWDAGEERRYELRVVDESTGAVVDAVPFSIGRKRS